MRIITQVPGSPSLRVIADRSHLARGRRLRLRLTRSRPTPTPTRASRSRDDRRSARRRTTRTVRFIAEIYAQALEAAASTSPRCLQRRASVDAYIPALQERRDQRCSRSTPATCFSLFDPETEARTSEDVYAALLDALAADDLSRLRLHRDRTRTRTS